MAIKETYYSEASLLSTILNSLNQGWYSSIVRASHGNAENLFAHDKNRAIFSALSSFYDRGVTPTTAGIVDFIESNYSGLFDDDAQDYVESIRLNAPIGSVNQVESVVSDLLDNFRARDQLAQLEQLIADIKDPEVDATPGDISTSLQDIVGEAQVDIEAQRFSEVVEEVVNSPISMWNLTTGINELDEVLGGGGLESGCLTIIAARPKVGKTALMNYLVNNVLNQSDSENAYPLVFNLETKKIEFTSKIMAGHIATNYSSSYEENNTLNWGSIKNYLAGVESVPTGVPGERKPFRLRKDQTERIEETKDWASQQDWYVSFDKSMTMQDIHALTLKAKSELPEDAKLVIFVDYLQLQVQNSRFEREEITNLSRFYKKMAGELDVSVVCLAQMNREGGKDGELDVRHLRGSGSLEQDADTIIMLDRPNLRDDTEPREKLYVDAGTTRLAEGNSFYLYMDGGTNIVTSLTDDMKAEFGQVDSGDFDEFTSDVDEI